MRRVLLVFGTRPEAIKLGPVVKRLRSDQGRFETRVCVTAQHRRLLDQVLDLFDIQPDHDLGAMRDAQSLTQTTGRILYALEAVLARERPDVIVVQGDTTSTVCGALAGFYNRVPVAHIEAGLRTASADEPFPEEMNRRVASEAAVWHFAATEEAAANLRAERAQGRIVVSGNPGIDALLETTALLEKRSLRPSSPIALDPEKRLILVTAHRRENFGAPLEEICSALARISRLRDVEIVYPVHPNPKVNKPVRARLAGIGDIRLVDPLDYVSFLDLMRRSYLILTDSGGIQEEAPALGKPVLILRESTERPEAVAAGASRIVGTNGAAIVQAVTNLMANREQYEAMARPRFLFGDGFAARRIVDALAEQSAATAAA